MILNGILQRILPMQSGTSKAGNEWQKVEFIVEETGSQHPDVLCITALNDHVQDLVGFNSGDAVEVEFSCRCNEYNGRVYNSLSLFKIAKEKVTAPQPQPQPQQGQIFNGGDDLPF